jgi:hypothetical protein
MNSKSIITGSVLATLFALGIGAPGMAAAESVRAEQGHRAQASRAADEHPGRGHAYGHDKGNNGKAYGHEKGARPPARSREHAGSPGRDRHDRPSFERHGTWSVPHRERHAYVSPYYHREGHHRPAPQIVERHHYHSHHYPITNPGYARIILNYPFWY